MKPLVKRLLTILALLYCTVASAYVPVEVVHQTTGIAPAFFGPYAYQVPDVSDGVMKSRPYAELAFDAVVGHIAGKGNEDYTFAPAFNVVLPLWTDRVNLKVYGEIQEYYRDNAAVRTLRRVDPSLPLKDHDAGALYFGLDILVLREASWWPAVVLSATTLSATGDHYEYARHYDAPGYHFTVSAGKNLPAGFRLSAYAGFLCWQIDRGRQNDAFMLGAKASYSCSWLQASVEYGQYAGVEHYGDCPRAIKARADFKLGSVAPFLYYSHGINDWPFDQFRIGVSYTLNLKSK